MKLSTVEAFKMMDTSSDQFVHLEGELLEKYQKVLLSIADDIIEVCEQEGIVYQLSGGSALGAVRHGGFIPWDDDMDINILGSQREQFIRAFTEIYSDRYWIHTYNTPEYGIDASKIRLKNSVSRGRDDVGNEECGFYIDIFYLENVFDNPVLRKVHGFFCMGFGLLLSCRNFYKNRALNRELEKTNPEFKKVFEFKIAIGRLLSFASVRRWAIMTHTVYSLCKNDHSKYVSIPTGRKHYFGEMYLREGMVNTVKMPFAGRQWNVAKDYDGYFNVLYGPDYMTPPPPEQREAHVLFELKFPGE
jgi:lipopolysaccharide cholinephosphotransferase